MQSTGYGYPQLGSSESTIDASPSEMSGPPGSPWYFHNGFDQTATSNKKRKLDRACDACRRRKTKCDGPKMPENICSNCLQTKKPCTYLEDSKPRGPSKAHVTALEDRMERLEALLKKLRPESDFTHELGPPVIRGSWKSQEASSIHHENQSGPSFLPSARTTQAYPTHSTHVLQSHMNNMTSSISGVPPVARTTHLMFDSQPTNRLHSKPERPDSGEASEDDKSTSSAHSSDSLTLEIENVTGLVKKLTLRTTEDDTRNPLNNSNRFHGRSSTVGLVEATRQFKLMHLLENLENVPPSNRSSPGTENLPTGSLTRRPEFWRTPPWERAWEGLKIQSSELFASVLAHFPPPDLAKTLIHLYFIHINTQLPLLHRPTFDRQWRENLHHEDIWFAAVCMSLFAVASRYSDDPRVITDGETHGEPDWKRAGWGYWEVSLGVHKARRSLFYPATLFEIQTFSLLGMFLRGTDEYPGAWILTSIGIRKAQDVGAHRQNVYRNKTTVDEELWKRAFWSLIVFDRVGGEALGRGCGVCEEDFDIDLPLEVDDEYWETSDPSEAFQQPSGVPAKVVSFNLFIKLSQVLAFALRTAYALDRSKIFCGLTVSEWPKVFDQLKSAMLDWKAIVPDHLVWPPRNENPAFNAQAAMLHTFYHYVEMLVYRPFIPSPLAPRFELHSPDRASLPHMVHPAMDICVEAARSCARIAEKQFQRGACLVPLLMQVAHVSAAMLLIKVWDLKMQEKAHHAQSTEDVKPPLVHMIDALLADVGVFIRVLEWGEPRWSLVSALLPKLRECIPGADRDRPHVQRAPAALTRPQGPLSDPYPRGPPSPPPPPPAQPGGHWRWPPAPRVFLKQEPTEPRYALGAPVRGHGPAPHMQRGRTASASADPGLAHRGGAAASYVSSGRRPSYLGHAACGDSCRADEGGARVRLAEDGRGHGHSNLDGDREPAQLYPQHVESRSAPSRGEFDRTADWIDGQLEATQQRRSVLHEIAPPSGFSWGPRDPGPSHIVHTRLFRPHGQHPQQRIFPPDYSLQD